MINWTVRLRNKTWLTSAMALVVRFVYDLLAMLDVVPPVGEEWVIELIKTVLLLLGMMGVVADPTTKGVGDSAQALTYTEPK